MTGGGAPGRNGGEGVCASPESAGRDRRPLSRHFDRRPGPWAGAERRNPEGALPTPQAPASARRPSPAGFLHSLRSVEMTGRGWQRRRPPGQLRVARGSALRPKWPNGRRRSHPSFRPPPVISTGGPARRAGAERRNPAGAPSTPQAPASARRPSPAGFLHSLRFGRNDGRGMRPVEMTVGCCASPEMTARGSALRPKWPDGRRRSHPSFRPPPVISTGAPAHRAGALPKRNYA